MNFIDVLELIRQKIESINPVEDRFLRSKGNDNGFEELFPIIANEVADELAPQNTLIVEEFLGHRFPDIDLSFNGLKYGIELKSRNNGSWSTNGNSVFESITGEGYEEIFIFFASQVPKEKRLLVKFTPYWKALSNIKVTHSPRFTINMDGPQNSVFSSKEEYDSLRTMNEEEKIRFLQSYLKENSIGAKWYTAPTETISPTKFSDLSFEQKDQLSVELLILFPDDLLIGNSREKYTRSAEYLLDTYYIYNKSFRDVFSAGGVYTFNKIDFPKIIGTLVSLKEPLSQTLNNASDDFFKLARDCWAINLPIDLISNNLYGSYANILDYLGSKETYNKLLAAANVSKLSTIVLES